MSAPLTDAELQAFLFKNPGWAVEGGMLTRTFEASSFLSGIAFVQKVAHAAEAADHHPDIDIRWRKVTLKLVTHDAGNRITALDAQLAAGATRLFSGH